MIRLPKTENGVPGEIRAHYGSKVAGLQSAAAHTPTLPLTHKMVATLGNAPSSTPFQGVTNLSQLSSHFGGDGGNQTHNRKFAKIPR